jgi:nucleoporin NUP82
LVLLEALETMRVDGPMDSEWPTFTSDACSRYTFFVTHTQGIYFLSLDPWVSSLEDEWAHESSHGTQFRLGVFASGPGVVRERVLRLNKHPHGSRAPATTSLVWRDQHLGYFLLTVSDGQPHAIVFDTKDEKSVQEPEAKRDEYEPDFKTIAMAPTRSTYRPPQVLWSKSPISTFLDTQVASRYKRMIKEEMRLSSASLEIMTEVHRVLSHETYQLGLAASDLFRRCERLQKELHDQILQARQISFNIERLNDGYVDGHSDEDAAKGKARVEERLQLAKKRQRLINTRTDALKRRITRASNRDLSEKEKAWVGEVEKMTSALFDDTDTDTDTSGSGGSSGSGGKELGERYAEVCRYRGRAAADCVPDMRYADKNPNQRAALRGQTSWPRQPKTRWEVCFQRSTGVATGQGRRRDGDVGSRVRWPFHGRLPASSRVEC